MYRSYYSQVRWVSVIFFINYHKHIRSNFLWTIPLKRKLSTRKAVKKLTYTTITGLSSPKWYGSWIYNYLCSWCLSPLMWIRLPLRARSETLCDKLCQWLAPGQWFSLGLLVSSNNKTDRHDITEIFLKVALNTITPNPTITLSILNFVKYNWKTQKKIQMYKSQTLIYTCI